MATDSKSESKETRQNDNLVKRLIKPLSQPGIINLKFADQIISRVRNMTASPSPELMRLAQRKGWINDSGAEYMQVVNAHWLQDNQNVKPDSENAVKTKTKPGVLQKKKLDSKPIVKAETQFSAAKASDLRHNKITSGLSGKEKNIDLKSDSETNVQTAIRSGFLQRGKEESEITAKPESISHTAVVHANTPKQMIMQKDKAIGRPTAVSHEPLVPGREGQRSNTKKTTAFMNIEPDLQTVKAIPQARQLENISRSESRANLQIRRVDREPATPPEPETQFSTAEASDIRHNEITCGLSGKEKHIDFKSDSETTVQTAIGSGIPQRGKDESKITAQPESISHTAVVHANTPKPMIMQKDKAIDRPTAVSHESLVPGREGQRLNKKKTTAFMNKEKNIEFKSDSETNVQTGIGSGILQRGKEESKITAKSESTSHTAVVHANTPKPMIMQKDKAIGRPTAVSHEPLVSSREGQRSNKNKTTASINIETFYPVDHAKWKIAKRGLPTTRLSFPRIQKKDNPDNGQIVIPKKSERSPSKAPLVMNKKEVEHTAVDLMGDKAVNAGAVKKNKTITEKPVIIENRIPVTEINLKTETPAMIGSTSYQIQKTPALTWRNNAGNATAGGISSGQTVHPVEKPVSVSMNSMGKHMLSMSNQPISSNEAIVEAAPADNTGNNISDRRTAAGGSNIDLSRLADQVSRIIYRKLAVERERRGV